MTVWILAAVFLGQPINLQVYPLSFRTEDACKMTLVEVRQAPEPFPIIWECAPVDMEVEQ